MASKIKRAGGEKKLGRYKHKVRLGLVPHTYDRNSKSFAAGAWKNLPHLELMTNRRALGMRDQQVSA